MRFGILPVRDFRYCVQEMKRLADKGFTAAMLLGIVVGTYSSISFSSSLLITLGLRAEPTPGKAPRVNRMENAERVRRRDEGAVP